MKTETRIAFLEICAGLLLFSAIFGRAAETVFAGAEGGDAPPPVVAPVTAAPLSVPDAPPAPVAAPMDIPNVPAVSADGPAINAPVAATATPLEITAAAAQAAPLLIAARAADGEEWARVFAWLDALPKPTNGRPITRDQENAAQLRGLIRSHGTNQATLEIAQRLFSQLSTSPNP